MKRAMRRLFRVFTLMLVFVAAWTVYGNVLSDDKALRAYAVDLARDHAGCGDACKIVEERIDRGMIEETVSVTIDKKGQVVVTCRRALVVVGEYSCVPRMSGAPAP